MRILHELVTTTPFVIYAIGFLVSVAIFANSICALCGINLGSSKVPPMNGGE